MQHALHMQYIVVYIYIYRNKESEGLWKLALLGAPDPRFEVPRLQNLRKSIKIIDFVVREALESLLKLLNR